MKTKDTIYFWTMFISVFLFAVSILSPLHYMAFVGMFAFMHIMLSIRYFSVITFNNNPSFWTI